jgi:hypothetical protein
MGYMLILAFSPQNYPNGSTCPSERRVDSLGGLLLHLWEHMGVDVQRDLNAGMT